MQPFSSAHPTRPTGCTAVLHFHPHTRISCPPRACTVRATCERESACVHFAGNDSTWSHGREMKSESIQGWHKEVIEEFEGTSRVHDRRTRENSTF